jgi:AcrR family transcriptional regulator
MSVKRAIVEERRPSKGARAEATRRALLAAARDAFGERGYGPTSVEEIVRRAGVTKGALYHHFRDKDDLFVAVVEEVKREVTGIVGASFLAFIDSHDDPLEAVTLGCLAFIDAHADPAVQRITIVDARSVLDGATRRDLDARYEVALVRGALRRAIRLGAVDRQPLAILAHIVTGALTEACALIAEAEDTEAARAEAGAVVTRLLEGLRARPADGQMPTS